MANFGFNLGDIDADAGGGGNYEPIPDGEYQLMCEEAEQRQTKAGTGYYIRAKFRVLGPSNANRIIFMNFNTQNPSSKAEEIGRRQCRTLIQDLRSFIELLGNLANPLFGIHHL